MRFSLATASCVAVAALLAGCSTTSQGTSSTPPSSAQSAESIQPLSQPIVNPDFVKGLGHLAPMKLLRLQAEGKLPGSMPRTMLERQLKQLQHQPRIQLNVRPDLTGVKIWTSMTYDNYLLGTGKSGNTVKAAIYTTPNGCEDPIGVKVDHTQNLWVGCQYDPSTGLGSVQEFSSNGTSEAAYNEGCPLSGSKYCSSTSAYGFDVAANSNNVFASLTSFSFDECTPSCAYVSGGGFEWWPAGSPSSTPTLIALPNGGLVYDVYYMDLDSSGNIWFDYYGCSTSCGYGLAEIQNPTSPSWSLVPIEPPGTYQFAGGVYVSNSGTVLNVIDQYARLVYQYSLPLSPSGSPFNTLGPTAFGFGDPVSGGFNATDSKMVIGDSSDWLDIGKLATNSWSVQKAVLFVSNLQGAAYTPSDK
jgi:hypothetical protein